MDAQSGASQDTILHLHITFKSTADDGPGLEAIPESSFINKKEHEQVTNNDTFIPYETLSEMYPNVGYDTDASENEYY